MFKVECLGCQAPYQVDEKRVPEKGLKMRCPKCGTSFKVEAPAPGNAATPAAPEIAPPAGSAPRAPAAAQRAFSSTALGASNPFGKAPGGRDSLARTMIGVSSADLGLALGPAPGGPSDPTQRKSFRIPRPNAGADAPASPTASPTDAAKAPAAVAPGVERVAAARVKPAPTAAAAFAAGAVEADLPAVPGVNERRGAGADEADLPASSTSWSFREATAEAAPESLAEPSAPLRLSELPQPVAMRAPERTRPAPTASREADAIPPLELDFGDDLPVAAPRAGRPPPRRARAPGPAGLFGATPPASSTRPEEADLPARLEDLEAGLPEAVVPRARPEPAAPRAPAVHVKASSLDELDLPAFAPRDETRGLPTPSVPKRGADPEPAARVATPKARPVSDVDLPAVASAALPARVRRPAVSDLPDILGAGLPEVSGADLPALQGAGLPQILGSSLPEVERAGLPAVQSAGLPEVVVAGLPEVAAGLPVVFAAGLPDILQSGLPGLTNTGLPEVSGRGVMGFGRIDLPLAREAGLPEVLGPGLGPVDLPSVGDALPALAGGPEWDEVTQSGTDAVPAEPDPFGSASADEDPFAGSEADFGAAPEADAFGAALDDAWDATGRSEEPTAEPRSGAGYGEVDIAGGSSNGALETAEDMEFSAIPERSGGPSGGRPAAHANVHGEGADSEATGSTLELGPERRPPSRRRSRRLGLALGVCGLVIAGGALSLEPRLGPFGAHFILDQVHRPQHQRLLADLVGDGRRSGAVDTFDAAVAALDRLEAGREAAPRFEPLLARAAYFHYDVALRFGPLPKLEAAGKAELDRLNPDSAAPGDRLARAARAALAHTSDAQHELEALGTDPDARQLLGELLLGAEDWPAAVQLWSERAQAEPQSSRALFGLARAELGAGNAAQASADVGRVIALNPDHVGARILALEAKRALDDTKAERGPDAPSTENLIAAVIQVLPHASPGEGALAHTVLGELHSSQGRAAPAQQAFEEALAIDRNFPRALIGLGETLEIAGRHAEALARFGAAAHLQPTSLPAQLGMAEAQLQLAHLPEAKALLAALLEKHPAHPSILYWRGRAEQAAGDNDAAFASYKASIAVGQGRAGGVSAYLALAKLQADLGQLAAAQTTLAEAREKLPPSGALNLALGEIDMTRGEYVDAYAHFQQALALDSNDTRARFSSAVALTRLGRFDEALDAFQSVGETDKDFPGLAVERGRLFEESGKNDQALREYEAAFVRSPGDLEVQTRVGCARVVAGKGKEAEDLLEKLTRARPRSAEASYCLGRALFEEERLVDASQRLERAVELDSTRAIYYLYLAWVESELTRNTDAEVALARALDLDKGLADAYWQRGRLRQKQGAVKDAIRDLEHALQLKPSRFEALADLASAYADLGRMPEALKAWEEAIARDPDNATWHFRYGKLLSSSGNGAVAAAHLRRAIDLASEAKDEKGGSAEKPKAPVWLWQAQYLLARELGQVTASIPHWQAYLRLAPRDDPYRHEAERALVALGQPWDQR